MAATATPMGWRRARSSAVRAGVVTAMPSTTVISSHSMRSSQTRTPRA